MKSRNGAECTRKYMSTVSQRSKHLQHCIFLKWNDYKLCLPAGKKPPRSRCLKIGATPVDFPIAIAGGFQPWLAADFAWPVGGVQGRNGFIGRLVIRDGGCSLGRLNGCLACWWRGFRGLRHVSPPANPRWPGRGAFRPGRHPGNQPGIPPPAPYRGDHRRPARR